MLRMCPYRASSMECGKKGIKEKEIEDRGSENGCAPFDSVRGVKLCSWNFRSRSRKETIRTSLWHFLFSVMISMTFLGSYSDIQRPIQPQASNSRAHHSIFALSPLCRPSISTKLIPLVKSIVLANTA